MIKISNLLLLSCLMTVASGHWETAHAQTNFYEGKTIRLIVGFTAGGGYDAYTRAIGRHMGKHIPGNPVMIVENMPGAGSMISANYTFKAARPDGLTIGHFIGGLFLQQLLGKPGIGVDQIDVAQGTGKRRIETGSPGDAQAPSGISQAADGAQLRQDGRSQTADLDGGARSRTDGAALRPAAEHTQRPGANYSQGVHGHDERSGLSRRSKESQSRHQCRRRRRAGTKRQGDIETGPRARRQAEGNSQIVTAIETPTDNTLGGSREFGKTLSGHDRDVVFSDHFLDAPF